MSNVRLIALALLAVGLAVRLVPYLGQHSLHLDEAALALNVIERPVAGLFAPLDHDQGAPIGFLMLAKLAQLVAGNGELALRAVPLLGSLCALLLLVSVGRAFLGERPALLVLACAAVSATLIFYAADFKQYACDVPAALVVTRAAERALRRGDLRSILVYGVVGALALVLSHPAVFVVAGTGLVLLGHEVQAGTRGRVLALGLVAASWAALFATLYFTVLRPLAENAYLREYWRGEMLPSPAAVWPTLAWLAASLGELVRAAGLGASMTGWSNTLPGHALSYFGLLVLGAGLVHLLRTDRVRALLLALPAALVLVAAALRTYPFSGRLVLFLAPATFVFVAAGLGQIRRGAGRTGPLLATVAAALLLLVPSARALYHTTRPPADEEIRPVLDHVQRRYRPGDTVYVFAGARRAFDYYHRHSGRHTLVGARVRYGEERGCDEQPYLLELSALGALPRVWVVASHFVDHRRGVDARPALLAALGLLGRRLEQLEAPGAAAYLYRLRPVAPSS